MSRQNRQMISADVGLCSRMNDRRKTWVKVFVALFVLIAGMPYVMMLFGLVLMPFDLSGVLFMPAIAIHNAYFFLPEHLFGSELYPAESFGYLPGITGYAIATLMYGTIAFGMSFPVAAVIRKLKQ
jgi:hypothetical protein